MSTGMLRRLTNRFIIIIIKTKTTLEFAIFIVIVYI